MLYQCRRSKRGQKLREPHCVHHLLPKQRCLQQHFLYSERQGNSLRSDRRLLHRQHSFAEHRLQADASKVGLAQRELHVVVDSYRGSGSIKPVKQSKNPGHLIRKHANYKYFVKQPIWRHRTCNAKRNENRRTDQVFQRELLKVSVSLNEGVDDVQQEGRGQQAEEPRAACIEIVFIALVVPQAIWEQQCAQQKERYSVGDNEGIGSECPSLDLKEAEFPPPKVHDRQQDRGYPAQVDHVEPVLTGVLHDTCNAQKQPREPKADHHAHDNPNVREDVMSGDNLLLHSGFIRRVTTRRTDSVTEAFSALKDPEGGTSVRLRSQHLSLARQPGTIAGQK